MGLPAAKRRYSVAEYLELERNSAERHEYLDGEVRAIADGTPEHTLIAANVIRSLGTEMKGVPCRVCDGQIRVSICDPSRLLYADASVICGPVEYDLQDAARQTVMNPRLIVEVLSPATEAYDRGVKFRHYRELGSLHEYVIVCHDAPRVEVYTRQPDGTWLVRFFDGPDAVARLRTPGIDLPLGEVYANVTFPFDPDDPRENLPGT